MKKKNKDTKKKKIKHIAPGTVRLTVDGNKALEWTDKSWKKSNMELPNAIEAIKLFKAHKRLDALIDNKNPLFLKGQLSPKHICQGARINILPDGRKLDKAYSLFAKDLTIHGESSNHHWDVLYQNPGGTFSYAYTLKKKKAALKRKYNTEMEFEKLQPRLNKHLIAALRDKKDPIAVPMYILLKTYMRIGNEIHYKAHGHKGLTTLKKNDITIRGNVVTFRYIGKDGVPRLISEKFPKQVIIRLKELLRPLKKSSFVFVNKTTGRPLRDTDFEHAFKRYCGKSFYPQIVRSAYATKTAKEFMKKHKHPSREEVRALFLSIAAKLGHRKYVKKEHVWKESYNVTTHYYIRPDLVEHLNSIVKNRKS